MTTDVVGGAQSGNGSDGVSIVGGRGSVSCSSDGPLYVCYGDVATSGGPGWARVDPGLCDVIL